MSATRRPMCFLTLFFLTLVDYLFQSSVSPSCFHLTVTASSFLFEHPPTLSACGCNQKNHDVLVEESLLSGSEEENWRKETEGTERNTGKMRTHERQRES